MSSIFFPPGLELVVSGRAAAQQVNEGGNIGKGFDALLDLRTTEQANARELFKVLAAANPNLASFVMSNTNLAQDLSETPKTIAGKAEVPFGQRVREAFSVAATAKLPSLFTPEMRRNAMNDVMKGVKTATEFSADPVTGAPRVVFSPQEIEILAESQLTGDLTEATALLGDEKMAAYLNSPEGEISSVEAMVLKVIKDAGGFINPDGSPYTEQQMVETLTEISTKLRGDPHALLEARIQSAELLNTIREKEFMLEMKIQREGVPLTANDREQYVIDIQALEAETAAGDMLVAGMRKMLDAQEAGTPIDRQKRMMLSALARTYAAPMGIQLPLGQMVLTNSITPETILRLESELLRTKALIALKEKRLARGKQIGADEAEARGGADAADTAHPQKGEKGFVGPDKDGGGEDPPLPPDPEAEALEILQSLEEALLKAEKGE